MGKRATVYRSSSRGLYLRRFYTREFRSLQKKRMGATNVGVRRAHSYSWSLSSPQQPLETEDSPTVSLAPQYTSQAACLARDFLLKNLRVRVSLVSLRDDGLELKNSANLET